MGDRILARLIMDSVCLIYYILVLSLIIYTMIWKKESNVTNYPLFKLDSQSRVQPFDKESSQRPQKSVDPGYEQCPICKRTFNKDRIQKHVIVCKQKKGKRQIFDSQAQRLTNVDSA